METDSRKMNYPYFYFFFGNWPPLLFDKKINSYKPSCPIAFLYGKDKKFQFHGQDWIKLLKETMDCEVEGLKGGHWVQNNNFKYCVDLIKRRISKDYK